MADIKLTRSGKTLSAAVGSRLSDVLTAAALPLPCGGNGKCGKCRVFASGRLSPPSETEKELLTESELRSGVRLACRTVIEGDCQVDLPGPAQPGDPGETVLTEGKRISFSVPAPPFDGFGAAVDIGTTTLAAKLYDRSGRETASFGCLNPQSAFGADVISRAEKASLGKADEMRALILNRIDGILLSLASRVSNAGTRTENAGGKRDEASAIGKINQIVITGNTAMLCLLTGDSTLPFLAAPFEAKRLFGETLTAADLGLHSVRPETEIFLPPCVSAFVGADTVCALLASGITDKNETALLADLGTNGEMALWHAGKLTVCSTAAGPAFEGVGISQGMTGSPGAIDRVALENGILHARVIGDGTAAGICGCGLIDAAACLLEAGAVDESGYLENDPVFLTDRVLLTGKDIRALQLAKSAVCAGMLTLLRDAGITEKDVSSLLIAGGFGTRLNGENAERIGLIPEGLAARTTALGNAALDGAAALLLDRTLRGKAAALARHAVNTDLSSDRRFSDAFIFGMELSPQSVKRLTDEQ